MEIETKYTVPDEDVYRRLCQLTELGGLPLTDPRTASVWDRYYDTTGYDFLRAGYTYRIRNKGGRVTATLKSLAPASGALHSREEYETTIEPGTALQPNSWPAGDAATLAQQISGGRPPELLFELLQERQTRSIVSPGGAAPAVELSLDKVEFAGAGEVFYELEAEELLPVQADLLARLHDALTGEWGLSAQPLSKFERALQLHRPDVFVMLPERTGQHSHE